MYQKIALKSAHLKFEYAGVAMAINKGRQAGKQKNVA